MDVNFVAVLAALVAMTVVSAFWFMVPFGKIWGKIHGFDKLSKSEQKAAQSKMGPWYLINAMFTLLTAYVLAHFMKELSSVEFYKLVFWLWLGFVLPTTAANMIFGGAPEGYTWHKIAISAGGSLVSLMAGAWVISLF